MDLQPELALGLPQDTLKQLKLFRRQYLQLLDIQHLTWPSPDHLRNSHVQEWIFKNCFEEGANVLPPERYRLRVLKPLLAKIEKAIVDPEEDVSFYY